MRRAGNKRAKFKKYLPLYLMTVPGFIYLFINNYMPMAGIQVAFRNYTPVKGIFKSDWVGLENFKFLFASADAAIIFRNTILYSFLFIIVNLIVSVTLAICLSEVVNKTHLKIFQSCILMPSLVSMIVVSYIVYGFLSYNGLINTFLEGIGLESIEFYRETVYWPFILTFVNMWKNIGFGTLMYFSSILSFDKSCYEAADLDGATAWQKIRFVTLPQLLPTMITLTILNCGQIMASDFSLFYFVPQNQGMLLSVTNTIDTYVYRALMQFNDVAMSSAASVFQSIVGFVLVVVVNKLAKKIDANSAIF